MFTFYGIPCRTEYLAVRNTLLYVERFGATDTTIHTARLIIDVYSAKCLSVSRM